MEELVMDRNFWAGKRVFVTGHTGFKGGWLCLWLHSMGAEVRGYSLAPNTSPALFDIGRISTVVDSVIGDIRDFSALKSCIAAFRPEVVFHLAAQPLVRQSYLDPVDTYSTNVMGTVHLLEAVRQVPGIKAVVNVTSDKCYENREWVWGYRESESMGGYDPYSSSKGCAELVTAAYRRSFFSGEQEGPVIASARAGNVIGGGDWAADRLVPDLLLAFEKEKSVIIRSPHAIRPWQHVLEPLGGYLLLAQQLYAQGSRFSGGWNFGPAQEDARPVSWIVERMIQQWGGQARWQLDDQVQPHEAGYLKLDCSKASSMLDWSPRWNLDEALRRIVAWHKAWLDSEDMQAYTLQEIQDFESAAGKLGS